MPIRLPYGKHTITPQDIEAVVCALNSPMLTGGKLVGAYEDAFAAAAMDDHAVAVSSGTAALHAMAAALIEAGRLQNGARVAIPAITFTASANAMVAAGLTPVFVDVDADTLCVDPAAVYEARPDAVLAVDFAGRLCDYEALFKTNVPVVMRDACHSLGVNVNFAGVDASVYSTHPVKSITTGEGGMVTTNDADLAMRVRRFRNHGIDSTMMERAAAGRHEYDMVAFGMNYRLSDIQAALGLSQLRNLAEWMQTRRDIAETYDWHLADMPRVFHMRPAPAGQHANHLYVVRVQERDRIWAALREKGIDCGVHYKPVHLMTYYREKHGTTPGICPVAERLSQQVLSLPIYPTMTDNDTLRVCRALLDVVG